MATTARISARGSRAALAFSPTAGSATTPAHGQVHRRIRKMAPPTCSSSSTEHASNISLFRNYVQKEKLLRAARYLNGYWICQDLHGKDGSRTPRWCSWFLATVFIHCTPNKYVGAGELSSCHRPFLRLPHSLRNSPCSTSLRLTP